EQRLGIEAPQVIEDRRDAAVRVQLRAAEKPEDSRVVDPGNRIGAGGRQVAADRDSLRSIAAGVARGARACLPDPLRTGDVELPDVVELRRALARQRVATEQPKVAGGIAPTGSAFPGTRIIAGGGRAERAIGDSRAHAAGARLPDPEPGRGGHRAAARRDVFPQIVEHARGAGGTGRAIPAEQPEIAAGVGPGDGSPAAPGVLV